MNYLSALLSPANLDILQYGNDNFKAGDELGYIYYCINSSYLLILDQIIDAQKRKGQTAGKKPMGGNGGARKVFAKKRQQNNRVSKFKRNSGRLGRVARFGNKKKSTAGAMQVTFYRLFVFIFFYVKKRIVVAKSQTFANVKNARIQKNRNMMKVTKNLVRKLVKVFINCLVKKILILSESNCSEFDYRSCQH